MSKSPVKRRAAALSVSQPVISATDEVAKVLAAFRAAPVRKASGLDRMVREVAAKEGVDLSKLSGGQKAAFTKRVRAACKAAGVSID